MANQSTTIQEMLSDYFLSAVKAVGLLYENRLYGHALVLIHSTIDTLGLLDAPPTQVSATGASYKAWAKKYLLPLANGEFNEVDLWGARCAVLHTFTSESDLSRDGKARELQFYSGDKSSEAARRFVAFTKTADGGKHVPVHWQDFCEAFFSALKAFLPVLEGNCNTNQAYAERLRKVLQIHPYA
jgi:hypothetical protein